MPVLKVKQNGQWENVGGGASSSALTQMQVDWEQTDPVAIDYIKNKPVIPSDYVTEVELATELRQISANLDEKLEQVEFNQVQVDWDQADESATDHIKNRPFYDSRVFETVENSVTWDGNTDGLEVATGSEEFGGFYRISDIICDIGEIIGSVVTVTIGDQSSNYSIDNCSPISEALCSVPINFTPINLYISTVDNNTFDGVTFLTNGIYYTKFDDSYEGYVSKITFGEPKTELVSGELKTLDLKYLPESHQFYEYATVNVIVDNFDTDSDNRPSCNFIPGNKYDVTWDGTLYEDVVCEVVDGFNALGNLDDYPFCIDDDGGDGFYFSPNGSHVISISENISEVKPIDEKYIPDTIARVSDVVSAKRSSFFITDKVNGYDYEITMEDGSLVSELVKYLTGITIETPPSNTEYIEGELFWPDDMVVVAHGVDGVSTAVYDYTFNTNPLTSDMTSIDICYMDNGVVYTAPVNIKVLIDGIFVQTPPNRKTYSVGDYFEPDGMVVSAILHNGERAVSGYTYSPSVIAEDTSAITITYVENDVTYTTTLDIAIGDPISEVLVDFTYTDGENGSATLTGWSQTFNGVASTEMIIPDDDRICLINQV